MSKRSKSWQPNPGTELDRVQYFRSEQSLSAFVEHAWEIVEPGKEMLWNWHLDLLCEYLEAITLEEEPHADWLAANPDHEGLIQKLIVNEPPGYMKSIIISIMWPCWEWVRKPGLRHIFSSYASGLSTQHSMARRTVIQSEWYMRGMHEYWNHPEFGLAGDENLKTQYNNNERGRMFSTSTGGTVTGAHGDRIVIDDPLNPEEAISESARVKCNRFFDLTLSQRVTDKDNPHYILVMQRLHDDDLTGHLKGQAGWVHVDLPVTVDEPVTLVYPRSGKTHERLPGILLWPEREGQAAIDKARITLGSWGFAGQYLQRPSPLEGGVYKRKWWGRGTPPTEFDRVLLSGDLAFKSTAGTDFVALGIIGVLGSNRWILDVINARMDFVETCRSLVDLSTKWPEASAKLIEDKANGPAVMSQLGNKLTGLIPVEPKGGKLARAMAAQPSVEAGNWHIPDDVEWANDFIEQCAAFPHVKFDDMVDMFTQAEAYLDGHQPFVIGRLPQG